MVTRGERKADLKAHSNGHVEGTQLVLSTHDGSMTLSFPPAVTTSVRYTINSMLSHGDLPRQLALTSALRGEGVTFVSRALGALIANDYGAKVCVVEMNWWWPMPSLGPEGSQLGLADLVAGRASLSDALVCCGLPNLFILTAGSLPPFERAVMARSKELRRVVDLLSRRFDHLVLDVPAILATSDAVPLAALGENRCMVIRQGVTTIEQVKAALEIIQHLSVDGVILNQVKTATPSWLLRFISQR